MQWFASKALIKKWISTGLDEGIAPNRRQTTIWTNVGLVYWRIHTSLGLSKLYAEGSQDIVYL